MAELPPARVDSLRHRPGLVPYWKKLLTIALVLGAGWFFCRSMRGPSHEELALESARKANTAAAYVSYATYHTDPDGVRDDLARLHEAARQKIRSAGGRPESLDRVFDVRWGDWYRSDEGQIVAWIASASDRAAVQERLG